MGTIGLNKNYFCFSFSTRPKDFDMMRLIVKHQNGNNSIRFFIELRIEKLSYSPFFQTTTDQALEYKTKMK